MFEHYFLIPDYQRYIGPLSEFDPNAILREINDDVNSIINKAFEFMRQGSIGDLTYMLPNTLHHVTTELNTHGKVLSLHESQVYMSAIQDTAKQYVIAMSGSSHWIARYPRWMGARHSLTAVGSVECLVDFDTVKYPDFDNGLLASEATPGMLNVVTQLIGSLGGKL